MRRVMSYRNAFAHGKFTANDKTVWLSYFEGEAQEQELTDSYLEDVERTLVDAGHMVLALQKKTSPIGGVKDHNLSQPPDSSPH